VDTRQEKSLLQKKRRRRKRRRKRKRKRKRKKRRKKKCLLKKLPQRFIFLVNLFNFIFKI